MKVRDVETGFVILLERNERVLESLTDFCARRSIKSGFFHALGAVKNAEIGYYSLEKREYFFKNFPEDREVASMTGNVALDNGKPFIHVHAVLSSTDESLSCIGGHLKECEVAVTLEIYLTPFVSPISRELDDAVGLKLLQP